MTTAPLLRSGVANLKYPSSIPTSSSAYFSDNSKVPIGVNVDEPRSDIDLESSGEYEQEDIFPLESRQIAEPMVWKSTK